MDEGSATAFVLFLPPTPPLISKRYPTTEVDKGIGAPSLVVPVWVCPEVPPKASAIALNSALRGGAVIFAPLMMSATEVLE
jgi:hypothetical protein